MAKTKFEELKFKQPEEPIVIPSKGIERPSKKLTANHRSLPILEDNQYTLISEGRDYYTVKCKGQSINVQKYVFDEPKAYIPRWVRDAQEEMEDNDFDYR